ncbi:MAG: hypothetical protein LBV80_10845 [Deltaproteobacteria bacterium]|jgi:hypothetical protein|nr:hypothetical protein [Deltaproteobacteria bacterium]
MSKTKKWMVCACGVLVLALTAQAVGMALAATVQTSALMPLAAGTELAAAPGSYSSPGASGSFGSHSLSGPGGSGWEQGRHSPPPSPDYGKSLRKRSPNDPEVFRTDNTNRRDDNANTPNKQ